MCEKIIYTNVSFLIEPEDAFLGGGEILLIKAK